VSEVAELLRCAHVEHADAVGHQRRRVVSRYLPDLTVIRWVE
jgi:hypothetical protein